MLALGEILMFPLLIVWVGWPLYIPIYKANKYLYYVTAPITGKIECLFHRMTE